MASAKISLNTVSLNERFDVSVSLSSKSVTTWINFVYHELLFYFPFLSQKLGRKYLPESFEKNTATQINIVETEYCLTFPIQ